MAEEEGCNSKFAKITYPYRRGGAWHCHVAALGPFSPDRGLRPRWVTHCADFSTKKPLAAPTHLSIKYKSKETTSAWKEMARAQGSNGWCIAPNAQQLLRSQRRASEVREQQRREGARARGAWVLAPHSGGAAGARAAVRPHQAAAIFLLVILCLSYVPSIFVTNPLIWYTPTWRKEHPCAQTQLSRAECVWDGAGDGELPWKLITLP